MIPKIIHYCWFGGNEMSPLLKKCVESWKKLEKKGYKIMRWDESNCDMHENQYIENMYKAKRWAFISDYFRFKAVYEYGGVYVDTDVYIFKDYDKYLDCDFFIDYWYDFALGGVFGGVKGNSLCLELMKKWESHTKEIISNSVITNYFLEKPQFILNGKYNEYVNEYNETVRIYPKETFEMGKIWGRSNSIHFNDGSWAKNNKKLDYRLKLFCAKFFPINLMSLRLHRKNKAALKQSGRFQEIYFATIKSK